MDQVGAGAPFQNPRSGWKHKAWGEAQLNPRLTKVQSRARAACDSAKTFELLIFLNGCRPLRGLLFLCPNDPGVPLRSTPGFMLSPRSAGSMQKLFSNFFKDSGRSFASQPSAAMERRALNDKTYCFDTRLMGAGLGTRRTGF